MQWYSTESAGIGTVVGIGVGIGAGIRTGIRVRIVMERGIGAGIVLYSHALRQVCQLYYFMFQYEQYMTGRIRR